MCTWLTPVHNMNKGKRKHGRSQHKKGKAHASKKQKFNQQKGKAPLKKKKKNIAKVKCFNCGNK